jgi:hypothetical protein
VRWRWPFRCVAISALALYIIIWIPASQPVGIGMDTVETTRSDPKITAEADWLRYLDQRLDALPDDDGPVVLVAASGGGSRAAMFTALVLDAMMTHIDPQGDLVTVLPEDAAIPKGHVLSARDPKRPMLRDRIALISGVSGGSLATAYFRHAQSAASNPFRRSLQNTVESELIVRMNEQVDYFTQEYQRDHPTEDPSSQVWECIRHYCRSLSDRSPNKKLLAWPVSSAFVDEMCTDFMAPLLRGMMMTSLERGQYVSRFWEKRFEWPSNPSYSGNDGPLMLLNASEVRRGTRLVIGYPPIATGLLLESLSDHGKDRSATLRPEAPRSLEALPLDATEKILATSALHSAYTERVSLADGVRLSANFPYGFSVARMRDFDEAHGLPEIHVLDGGIVDNTGIDSLRHVLRALANLAEDDRPERAPLKAKARTILEKLRKRGVLLIEIDSGAKMGKPGWLASKVPAVSEPLQCLNNAAYVGPHFSKEMFLDAEFNDILGGTEDNVAFRRLTFICNHSDDVMTAWSLGPQDKASVLVQFLFELEVNLKQMADPQGPMKVFIKENNLFSQRNRVFQQKQKQDKPEEVQQSDAMIQKADDELKALARRSSTSQETADKDANHRKRVYEEFRASAVRQSLPPFRPPVKAPAPGSVSPPHDCLVQRLENR